MALIEGTEVLAESDLVRGHHRVYTPQVLREHAESAGLGIHGEVPFYFKPLATATLTPLPPEVHRGLFLLGRRLPEFASYIYLRAMGPT